MDFFVRMKRSPSDEPMLLNRTPREIIRIKMISITIVGFVTFVGDSARGILYPALWPQCQYLGGNSVDLGFLVSSFSIGRMLVSTRMGILTDKYRHRFTLMLSSVILLAGVILWANSAIAGGLIALYAAQFIMGVGTGNLGVLRSYVAEQSPPEKRTYMLARLSALQYAGFAATPLAGSALFVAGASVGVYWQYAMPAYLMAFMVFACCMFLFYPFEDIQEDNDAAVKDGAGKTLSSPSKGMSHQHHIHESQPLIYDQLDNDDCDHDIRSDDDTIVFNKVFIDSNHNQTSASQQNAYHEFSSFSTVTDDTIGVGTSTGNNISSAISVLEDCALNGDDSEENIEKLKFEADKAQVFKLFVFLNFTTRGVVAVYESLGSQLFLGEFGFSELVLGAFVTICGILGTLQLIFFKEFWCKYFSDMTLMLGGISIMTLAQCLPSNFGPDESRMPWQFSTSFLLIYSLGYPLGNSAVLGLFSSLQKSGRQGKAQSQFALAGSVARVVMPIISGYLNQYVEATAAFGLCISLMSISIICIIWNYWKIMFFAYAIDKSGDIIEDSPYCDRNRPFSVLQWSFLVFWCLLAAIGVLIIFDFGVPTW